VIIVTNTKYFSFSALLTYVLVQLFNQIKIMIFRFIPTLSVIIVTNTKYFSLSVRFSLLMYNQIYFSRFYQLFPYSIETN